MYHDDEFEWVTPLNFKHLPVRQECVARIVTGTISDVEDCNSDKSRRKTMKNASNFTNGISLAKMQAIIQTVDK